MRGASAESRVQIINLDRSVENCRRSIAGNANNCGSTADHDEIRVLDIVSFSGRQDHSEGLKRLPPGSLL
jgi:hypothetical protein